MITFSSFTFPWWQSVTLLIYCHPLSFLTAFSVSFVFIQKEEKQQLRKKEWGGKRWDIKGGEIEKAEVGEEKRWSWLWGVCDQEVMWLVLSIFCPSTNQWDLFLATNYTEVVTAPSTINSNSQTVNKLQCDAFIEIGIMAESKIFYSNICTESSHDCTILHHHCEIWRMERNNKERNWRKITFPHFFPIFCWLFEWK